MIKKLGDIKNTLSENSKKNFFPKCETMLFSKAFKKHMSYSNVFTYTFEYSCFSLINVFLILM